MQRARAAEEEEDYVAITHGNRALCPHRQTHNSSHTLRKFSEKKRVTLAAYLELSPSPCFFTIVFFSVTLSTGPCVVHLLAKRNDRQIVNKLAERNFMREKGQAHNIWQNKWI